MTEQSPVNLDDERLLIDASRRGDPEAFASLVARYQRMIHALTYRMSGSEADASDQHFAGLPRSPIEAQIDGDAIQPGRKACLASKAVQAAPSLDKRLLRKV